MQKEYREPPFASKDVFEAAPDFVAIHAGANPNDANPVAAELVEERFGLSDVAAVYGQMAGIARGQRLEGYRAVSAAISSADFQQALADGLRRAILQRVQATDTHRRVCHVIRVPDFKSVLISKLDVDTELPELRENGEMKTVRLQATDGKVLGQVKTYAAALRISREIVINDDVGLLRRIANQMAVSAIRREAEGVYGILADNPDLPDGDPMFAGSNSLDGIALDAAGLGQALAYLRTQTDRFEKPADNQAAHLIVAPDLEYAAHKLVADITTQTNRPALRVVSAPWVPAGRWYLQADPEDAPTIGFLSIEAPGERNINPVTVSRRKLPPEADGIGLHVMSDFGTVAMSRLGIVRGGGE